MSTGSPKDKPNRRLTQVSATTRTTDPAVEVGNQDERQWWARMRRAVANFFPEKAKRIPECSDAVAKPLTVTEQIYVGFQLERLDRYGFYQQPLRNRANDPLDQLLSPQRRDEPASKD